MSIDLVLAIISLGLWTGLFFFRGWFWAYSGDLEKDAHAPPPPARWPSVCAIVPARNEETLVREAVQSLREQDYPGPFHIVLVDDESTDDTAAKARQAKGLHGLSVTCVKRRNPDWSGKLWAMQTGLQQDAAQRARYIWFTDADIRHDPGVLRRLTAKAEGDRRALVSEMVRLSTDGLWDRVFVPAFIYFFRFLYPFRWANAPDRKTAAAAGGSMLVKRDALESAGGLAVIRGAIIDDCSLAALIKGQGHAIWIGLTDRSQSLRDYGPADFWRMVRRTAFTQLGRSWLALLGMLAGLGILFILPPVLTLAGTSVAAAVAAGAAWAILSLSYMPSLLRYRQTVLFAPFLPLLTVIYMGMTLDSALQHARGRGGAWKGRVYGN